MSNPREQRAAERAQRRAEAQEYYERKLSEDKARREHGAATAPAKVASGPRRD